MTRIIPTYGLNSPAAVEMGKCNRILVDPLKWPFIPPAQRQFIIAHEQAHCLHEIEDETEADRVGFSRFVANGGDPEDAYKALTNHLDMEDSRNQSRADLMSQHIQQMQYGERRTFETDPSAQTYGSYGNGGFGGFGTYGDPATPEPDDSGWGFGEWQEFLGTLGGLAPDIINAARGQSGYVPPVQGNPDSLGGSPTNWTAIGLIGGGLLMLFLVIVLAIKK